MQMHYTQIKYKVFDSVVVIQDSCADITIEGRTAVVVVTGDNCHINFKASDDYDERSDLFIIGQNVVFKATGSLRVTAMTHEKQLGQYLRRFGPIQIGEISKEGLQPNVSYRPGGYEMEDMTFQIVPPKRKRRAKKNSK